VADLIQQAWLAAKGAEDAGCPDPGELALAALNGPSSVSAQALRHLRSSDCERCRFVLLETCSMRCPPAHVLTAAQAMPADSVFRSALSEHADSCEGAQCFAAREQLAALPAAAAPSVRRPTAREVVTDYAGRLGDAVRTVFYPKGRPFGDVRPAMLSRQPGELPSGASASAGIRFRRAITLTAVSDERLLVTVDFNQIEEAGGGPATLLVLRDDRDELLIERRIERSSGVARFEFQVDTSVLSGDVKAAILFADG
jgi:hypothetical protein